MQIDREHPHYPVWLMSIALILLVLAAYGVVDRIDQRADKIDAAAEQVAVSVTAAAQRIITARELAKGYDRCPPAEPGMTDVITMVIRSGADNKPEVLTCIRYAERPYAPRTKRMANPIVLTQSE